jgi:hypothetical protein
MGNSSYSVSDRTIRSTSKGYSTKSANEIFTQNVERKIHKMMDPNGVVFRESCDSDLHPLTTAIQLYLDNTGSMLHIPLEMIKDGLPTLMGTLIQNGVPDAALMFGIIGDHECDHFPLQIGQFESGDAELDLWLTRSYLEGGGGGNAGESYNLAWYFGANHVKTDAFDKRKQKGFIFTIGDEPCLPNLPVSAVKGIMGSAAVGQGNFTREELLAAAQEKNHVYHIHINHAGRRCDPSWKELLGANLIEISDHKTIPKVISDIILKVNSDLGLLQAETPVKKQEKEKKDETETPIENFL